jgi:hypothetical protein
LCCKMSIIIILKLPKKRSLRTCGDFGTGEAIHCKCMFLSGLLRRRFMATSRKDKILSFFILNIFFFYDLFS